MRRTVLTRLLSSLFALWFVLMLGDPGVLHACPEHGGHSMHGSTAGHASHQMGPGHDAPATALGCTCLGTCSAAAAVAALPESATFAVEAHIIAPVSQPEFGGAVRSAHPDRLLPFANGPPQA